eukprot:1544453-Pyramimonas_sp.AAC.1
MAEEAKPKKAQETQAEQAQQNGVKAEAGPDFPNVDEADIDEMRDFLQASGVNVPSCHKKKRMFAGRFAR